MKKLIAILFVTACTTAFAAPPSRESVETLLTLSKADQVLDVIYGNMEQSMRQGMQAAAGNKPLTPEQQRVLQALPAKMTQFMRQEMSWPALKPLLVKVYVETFDQEEIDGLAEFFRSPIGQRFIDKQAVVAQRSSLAAQQLLASVLPKLQSEVAAELRKAGIEPNK
jgi:hypothetical protein